MPQTYTVVIPQTVEITGTDYRRADLSNYKSGTLSCKLVAAEEVTIFKLSGPDITVANDKDGVVQKLTASINSLVLEGGCCYFVLKTTCATAYGVYLDYGPGLNS